MLWLSRWFKSKKEIFLSLALKAVKIFFGQLAEDAYALVERNVEKAEGMDATGLEKYKFAYKTTKQELRENLPDYLINLLIEIAVMALKEARD